MIDKLNKIKNKVTGSNNPKEKHFVIYNEMRGSFLQMKFGKPKLVKTIITLSDDDSLILRTDIIPDNDQSELVDSNSNSNSDIPMLNKDKLNDLELLISQKTLHELIRYCNENFASLIKQDPEDPINRKFIQRQNGKDHLMLVPNLVIYSYSVIAPVLVRIDYMDPLQLPKIFQLRESNQLFSYSPSYKQFVLKSFSFLLASYNLAK